MSIGCRKHHPQKATTFWRVQSQQPTVGINITPVSRWQSHLKWVIVFLFLVDVRSGEANDETTAPFNNAVAAGVAAAPTGMLAPDRVTTLSVSLIRMVQSDQAAALESHSMLGIRCSCSS